MSEKRTITAADLENMYQAPNSDALRSMLEKFGISVEVPIPEPEGDVLVAVDGILYHPGGPDGWQTYGQPHSTGRTWADVLGDADGITVYRADGMTRADDDKVRGILVAAITGRTSTAAADRALIVMERQGLRICEVGA